MINPGQTVSITFGPEKSLAGVIAMIGIRKIDSDFHGSLRLGDEGRPSYDAKKQ
jgi:hypothetical protein